MEQKLPCHYTGLLSGDSGLNNEIGTLAPMRFAGPNTWTKAQTLFSADYAHTTLVRVNTVMHRIVGSIESAIGPWKPLQSCSQPQSQENTTVQKQILRIFTKS